MSDTLPGAPGDVPSRTRRAALQGVGVLMGAALLAGAGCTRLAERAFPVAKNSGEEPALPPPSVNASPIVRVLNRAGWGPAPGDVARVAAQGLPAYIEEQLAPPDQDGVTSEPPALQVRLLNCDVLNNDPYELRDLPEDEVMLQLQQVLLLRAAYSPWQLRERMADFWSNHFNLYARKNVGEYLACNLISRDTETVVRTHALGKFPDMIKASAKSPAMLGYLDNQLNRAGVGGENHANENYARELMELHTLGVDGGYTQRDVQEVARCLTGWTIEDGFLKDRGGFVFDENLHDKGEKTVLGVRIPAGGGQEDGERVLEILGTHPSTARFIGTKLARYFHGEPTEATIRETSALYLKTGGDIRAMVRHLLTTPAFHESPPILKRPFDFCVSAVRATGADTDGKTGILDHLAKMGQSPYQWPMPDGYPDRTVAWTGSLLARWNFALAFAESRIGGTGANFPDAPTAPDSPNAATLIARILSLRPDAPEVGTLVNTFASHTPREQIALLLCSPMFQWR